jgi:hypothetical protein
MAILTKGTTFADGDQVTSTKLNNLVDAAAFVAGSSGTTDDATLEVAGGQLRVKTIQSGNIASLAVTEGKIGANAVTSAKIAASAVGTTHLADSGVTAAKLATDAVEAAKIKDANVTAAKLSGAQTGTAPVFGVRAWVVFDMTRNAAGTADALNTTRFIQSSGNVTSVTKNATGDFTVAFTTAMADADYGWFGTAMSDDADGDFTIGRVAGGTKTTTSLRLKCVNTGNSARDSAEVCISIIR